jgi:multicomponent K+:H+ antiporter subunit G
MMRLHGPTKATTLGVGGCLLASMLHFAVHGGRWSAHELLIALFLFVTAPISANMIAKAYLHRRNVLRDAEEGAPLPPAPPHAGWATFGDGGTAAKRDDQGR